MRNVALLGVSLSLLLSLGCLGQNDGGRTAQRGERFRNRRAKTAPAPSAATATLQGLYGQVAPKVELAAENLEATDAARKKTVPFRVTYPKGDGRWPVIVWSHGLYGSQDNYGPLVEHWARHGYLVVQPSHSDSLKRGKGNYSKGMRGNTGDWASRPQDVSFLLDYLGKSPKLSAYADLSRVGMGGHSFGAHTTVLVEGAKPSFGPDYKDPRPRAFIAISPQGESRLFTSASWSGLTRPTLFISGDNDDQPSGEKAPWRLSSFEKSPAGEKYLLWVKNAYHNFGGMTGHIRAGSGPANADHVEVVKSATLAFWDSQLKEQASARSVIGKGDLGGASRNFYTWKSR